VHEPRYGGKPHKACWLRQHRALRVRITERSGEPKMQVCQQAFSAALSGARSVRKEHLAASGDTALQ